MKDHALICKFVGIRPTEKYLLKWIHAKWQPKGHIELKFGPRELFIVIFTDLLDK